MKLKWLLYLIVLVLVGCREEVALELNKNPQLLVVDGTITNNPGPYIISLSLTSTLIDPQNIPLSGCIVTIYDDSGNSEVLTELEPGVYYTSASGMQGQIGSSYKITILSPDGKEYESDFSMMKEPIGIESIYADTTTISSQEFPSGLPGIQFFTNSNIGQTPDNFFLWRIIETYKYDANNTLHAVYQHGRIFVNNVDTTFSFDTLRTCWKTQQIKNIYTGKTSNLSIPKIINQPLHFVGTDSKRLTQRYGFLLEQLTIDEQAYDFWRKVEEQISEENIFVAKQPYNIVGNIKNVNNPSEKVLGYFTVAAVDQKRMFVSRPNMPFYVSTCFVVTDLRNMFRQSGPFYLVLSDQGLGKVHPDCIDCRSEGGVTEKPGFWVD